MRRSFNRFINNFVGFLRLFVYANFWVAGAVYALTRVHRNGRKRIQAIIGRTECVWYFCRLRFCTDILKVLP